MDAFILKSPDPRQELVNLGCDAREIDLLSSLIKHHTIRLRGLSRAEALTLKREALATGAVVALPSDTAEMRSNGTTDLLLAGSEKSLVKTAETIKLQPGSLAAAGENIIRVMCLARRKKGDLQLGGYTLPLGRRTLIMGVLNLTPDSFSDGGRYGDLETALARARQMTGEGADIIDIGGESTRPGSHRVGEREELARVMPVIKALKEDKNFQTPLSIDTYKAAVAREALQAGVEMINDVWGLKEDPSLGAVAAEFGAALCLMHNRAGTEYGDLITDVIAELRHSIDLAHGAGVKDRAIIIDPGIGFGKDLKQNLAVMRHLPDIQALGYPLLLGTSRKSMIGKTLDLPVEERLEGTAATVAYGIAAGADIVRVHDVREMRRVAQMTDAMTGRRTI